MQNIPVFTTEFGVASLILKEIPYTQTAYIKIQSSLSPVDLLEECVSFCRIVGAERILASGHDFLSAYPLHTQILRMERRIEPLPKTEAEPVPVTQQTLGRWLEIYNKRMSGVDNASYMSQQDGKEMLRRGDGYFVYRNGDLIGIAVASGEKIDAVASAVPGGGKETVLALGKILSGQRIILDVASTNLRAIRLYESLGFSQKQVLSQWYKII